MPIGIKTASGRVREVMERGLHQGMVQTSPISASWNIAGRCLSPVPIGLHGQAHAAIMERHNEPSGRYLDMDVRCRKCRECLWYRRYEWTQRAKAELQRSARTWWGTLTLSPQSQYEMLVRALAKVREQGVPPSSLSDEEIFRLRSAEAGAEVTKYLKRIRKQSEAKLRHLAVVEKHKSGLPHFHMLLHEVSPAAPVRKRVLDAKWPFGITHWRLVPDDETVHAHYVCKYLSKSYEARVRASLRYGQGWCPDPVILSQQIVEETEDVKNIAPAHTHEPCSPATSVLLGKKA